MKNEFITLLAKLNISVYATPVEETSTIVFLGRLTPLNDEDKDFKLAESRLLNFIERALIKFKDHETVKVRFSRPWLLKDDKLAYTWDFTFRGDLEEAYALLSTLRIPTNPAVREESAPLQQITPKRGKVKAVTIGRLV